jgi:dynein light chain LC8-type
MTPFKAQAEHIKKHLDLKFGGSWHVIVGNSFSSYMTYEDSSVILFWLNQWGFLIFKYG